MATKKKKTTPHPTRPLMIRLESDLRGDLEAYAHEYHLTMSGAVRSLLVRALRAEKPQ